VNIAGPGAAMITVSGNKMLAVFYIFPAITATITGLTIANGNQIGIANRGSLAVIDCTVCDNGIGIYALSDHP
jgi:hypothetical protein